MSDPAGPREPEPFRAELAPGVRLPVEEITWRFSTSGGPGGQHVNTSNTRAEATLDIARSPSLPGWARERLVGAFGPTVSVAASDTRSQTRNRQLALSRLATQLARALIVQAPRRATRPSAASQRRRLDEKRRRGRLKQDRRRGPDEGRERT
ncbi:MAG: aminoacyl-tRNA hydrolase [Acidimicrobiales bacterium]|nr:aminoacyl-tRNA hydrolase [Acidimicrobiales bacterium]